MFIVKQILNRGLGRYSEVRYVVLFTCMEIDTHMPRKLSLSAHLRNARKQRGLSVAQVAAQIGVSEAAVYFWETDHCKPRAANLTALCRLLKLPIRATRELAA